MLQALEFDKLAPETYIVIGNCFSLQKEHETALKFFKR
jgi:anaphase-promoting complex subunit 3